MKRRMGQWAAWWRSWVTLPKRAGAYRVHLETHAEARLHFNDLAGELGYLGEDYLDAAISIAIRCKMAEQQVMRLEATRRQEAAERPLPGLSAAEIERLAMLSEECGELVQAVGKVLRHGYNSQPPRGGRTNRVSLEREMGDVRAVTELLIDSGDTRHAVVNSWRNEKRAQLRKWTHHQEFSIVAASQISSQGEGR